MTMIMILKTITIAIINENDNNKCIIDEDNIDLIVVHKQRDKNIPINSIIMINELCKGVTI